MNNNKLIYENNINQKENEIIKLKNELNNKNEELKNLKLKFYENM